VYEAEPLTRRIAKLEPIVKRAVQQFIRADNVRMNERSRSGYRAVDVGFCCKMQDRGRSISGNDVRNGRAVAYIRFFEE